MCEGWRLQLWFQHRETSKGFSVGSVFHPQEETARYWIAPEEESYKSDVLKTYQRLLRLRGITDPETLRLLSSQILIEEGTLTGTRDGDHGCSVGIPQMNACVHYGISAKTFRARHPEWNDVGHQLLWMADAMKDNIDQYGTVRLAIISHNSPACSSRGCSDTKAGYYAKVKKQSLQLVLE